LSTLLPNDQETAVEPGDDDIFAYSSVVADGENISKIKNEARAQAGPKAPPKPKEEKFDEDSAIADYSDRLAENEKGGDESGGISLAEKMLSNKKEDGLEDDDEPKDTKDEDKSKIDYWASQDPDGSKKKAADAAAALALEKKKKDDQEK
jgi:hypothetical protein